MSYLALQQLGRVLRKPKERHKAISMVVTFFGAYMVVFDRAIDLRSEAELDFWCIMNVTGSYTKFQWSCEFDDETDAMLCYMAFA